MVNDVIMIQRKKEGSSELRKGVKKGGQQKKLADEKAVKSLVASAG